MAHSYFFELVLKGMPPEERQEDVEDILEERLADAGCGEVTGGGTGMDQSIVDIELTDVDVGIQVIREILKEAGLASGAKLIQRQPTYRVITFDGK